MCCYSEYSRKYIASTHEHAQTSTKNTQAFVQHNIATVFNKISIQQPIWKTRTDTTSFQIDNVKPKRNMYTHVYAYHLN